MDLIGSLFNNAISKRVSEQLAIKQSTSFASALSYINMRLNEALPTINPDGQDYYNYFKTVGAVYEVTDAITKKVLNCPIVFYKIKDKAKLTRSKSVEKSDPVQAYILKMQAIEEVDVPELAKLLGSGKANPYQTGSQMMWCTVLTFLLHGNSYVHSIKAGKKAKELYCFPNMTIAADIEDLLDPVRGYILQNTSQTRFDIDEIQHIKTGTPAPIDRTMRYLYGVSPIQAYYESNRSITEGKAQASKQAKNGGALGIVAPKNKEDQWTKDQKGQFKENLTEAHESTGALARILPSSIGLEWLQIGLPINDLQLLELVSASEEDIYRAYHWPLQFHNQKASTSNNQATAVKQAVYDAVAPVCDAIGEAFTQMLSEGYGGITIELDYTQLPEMAVNMKDVAAYLSALPKGVLTPNEMRAVLKYGESTEKYMNEHYVESNVTTMRRVFDGTATTPPTDVVATT